MKTGKIYILRNSAHKNTIVKIGRTIRDSEERAKEVSSATGVPLGFEVLYDEDVFDCIQAEKIIHKALQGKRINLSREFFDLPLKEAVEVVFRTCMKVNKNCKKKSDSRLVIFLGKGKNTFEDIKKHLIGHKRKKVKVWLVVDTNNYKRVFILVGEEMYVDLTPKLINNLKSIRGVKDILWMSDDLKQLGNFDSNEDVGWDVETASSPSGSDKG